MVSMQSIQKQLKGLGFKTHGWGRGEVRELPNIILPDEEIFEIVNGIYEGGFALLVATNVRVLLVDKKPLNYLTVEDLRFDMINEMDYSHRLLGAQINIATGNKTLLFRSYNQPRLRKLIGHVQHCMAEVKKQQNSHQEGQNQNLEQINQQLQAYLFAQQQQQLQIQQMQRNGVQPQAMPEPVRPGNELSDYLFAQSLMAQYQAQTGQTDQTLQPNSLMNQISQPTVLPAAPLTELELPPTSQLRELYNEGMQEIFGAPAQPAAAPAPSQAQSQPAPAHHPLEINPMRIAYSKLPMALRNRKFGRPSFHAHSQEAPQAPLPIAEL